MRPNTMKILQATLPYLQDFYSSFQCNLHLAINRFKEIVYEEVEYDGQNVIIDRIKKLTQERDVVLSKLNSIR